MLRSAEINDIRSGPDFKTSSFSKYKRSDVNKELIQCMAKGRVEAAVHWCAELACAGHFADIWECIITALARYSGNAKVAIYIESKLAAFKHILNQGEFARELDLRNQSTIRAIFAEVVCVICFAPKRSVLEPIKLDKNEGFDVLLIQERLTAPDTELGDDIFCKEDPKELYIAINEFAYCISPQSANLAGACYWIEWIIEFAAICLRRKTTCKCMRRDFAEVPPARQMDVIWMIWDCIRHRAQYKSKLIQKAVDAALSLFSLNYTPAACKRRRHLLHFVVSIVIDTTERATEIIAEKDKPVLHSVLSQLNDLYADIKQNEVSANTDYLFSSLDDARNTMDASIKKMQMMNAMDLPAFFDDRPI